MSETEKHEHGFHFDSVGNLRSGSLPVSQLVDDLIDHLDGQVEATTKNEANEHVLIPGTSLLKTPVFVYNKERIVGNFKRYSDAFDAKLRAAHGIESHISYSMKANFNPSILRIYHGLGSWCSLVNENELRLALKVGFPGSRLIFNGNGKTLGEIELAVSSGCYLNIDSQFNLVHTIGVCKRLNSSRKAQLIIRVNQPISVDVHSYLNTSFRDSKFGVIPSYIEPLLELIEQNEDLVELHGFHVHLGSTIKSLDVYQKAVDNIVELFKSVRERFGSLRLLNLGGGLGIDYEKFADRTRPTGADEPGHKSLPTPADLAGTIAERVKDLKGLAIVVEPGRSLIADAAILLTKVIGVKQTEHRRFIVVDASMCEVIRPCLYSAYHFIDYVKPLDQEQSSGKELVDIVGPVCESGDFLGKDRYLQYPLENFDCSQRSLFMAVFDVGAYCSSMASNYNLHSRPAEIFVSHSEQRESAEYILTKRSETLDGMLSTFM